MLGFWAGGKGAEVKLNISWYIFVYIFGGGPDVVCDRLEETGRRRMKAGDETDNFVPCWTERDVEPLIWRRVFVSVLLFKNLSSCWWKPNTRLKGCGRVICNSRCMGGGCWRQLQSAFLPPWSSAAETATWQTCLFLLLPTFKRP